MRDKLEKTLLKVCADIGWICGWREERPEPAPAARRSSRKRVMLGRALAAEAKVQDAEAFRPVAAGFVSSGRIAYAQSEPAVEVSGLADIAYDLQDELARLGRIGTSASQVAGAFGETRLRALGRQLQERRRSVL